MRRRWAAAFFAIITGLVLPSGETAAYLLDYGGLADLTYSHYVIHQNGSETKVGTLQQRYSLRGLTDLWDPRLGTFAATGTFLDEQVDTQGIVSNQRTDILDYSFFLNLFPRWTPLSLFYQKVSRDITSQAFPGLTPETNTTTFIANWDLPLRRFPRVHLNYSQTELKSDPALIGPDQRTQVAGVDTEGQWKDTRLSTRYQYSTVHGKGGFSGTSHAGNVNIEQVITPSLTARLHGSYSQNATSIGPSFPGVTFFQEKSAGATLFYRSRGIKLPPVDGTLGYDYSENPLKGSTTFRRHTAVTNWNIRPLRELDLFANARYLLFDIDPTQTRSYFGSTGASWRPFFNFQTGINLSQGRTDISGPTSSHTTFGNYNYFLSYTKTVHVLRLSGTGNIGYSSTETNQSSTSSLLESITLSAENTNIRIAHGAVAYTVSAIDQTVDGTNTENRADNDQIENRVQVNADSSYFRNLVLFGSARYSAITGDVGVVGSSTAEDARATYYIWRGLSVSAGYLREDFTSAIFHDRQSTFEEAQWVYLLGRGAVTLNGKHSVDDFDTLPTSRSLEGRSSFSYQVGRLFLNAEYRVTREERGESTVRTNAYFLRASRAF